MSSLKRCLTKINLPEQQATALREAVKEYREEDYSAHDAALHAVKDMLADLYAERADIVRQIEEQGGVAPEATTSLRDKLYAQIGKIKNNRDLKKTIAEYRNIPSAQVTDALLKEGQEAIEAALTIRAKEIVKEGGTDKEIFEKLKDLYESQPNLNVRSTTSIERQAYSTPAPIAYLSSRLAGIDQDATVYEPTAGNGMLLIGANPDRTVANELTDTRAEALIEQGYETTQHDATQWVPDREFDSVIMNPPFGKLRRADGGIQKVDMDGYKISSIDHLVAAKALQAMKDDGRAVLIIGAERKEGEIGAGDRVFFNWLYSNYNVVDHFELSGDFYKRQGAGWPIRVITVAGREKSDKVSPKSGVIERLETWEQLYGRYETGLAAIESKPERAEGYATPRPEERAYDESQGEGVAETEATGSDTGRTGVGRSKGSANERSRTEPGSQGTDQTDRVGERDNGNRYGTEAGKTRGRRDKTEAESRTGKDGEGANLGRMGKRPRSKSVKGGSQYQADYEARSAGPNEAVLTPKNMAQATEDALSELEAKVGNLDTYVMDKLGYTDRNEFFDAFMGLQVDSVAAAIYNMENGKGIIIADQTGVGKGRQAAAIIRYAHRVGKIPVFMSVKDNLFTDMSGDLKDIKADEIRPLIMNQDAVIKDGSKVVEKNPSAPKHRKRLQQIADTGELPEGYNALFLTYSQIRRENLQRNVLDALRTKALFILDEAHEVAGEREKPVKGGGTKKTGAGFMFDLIKGQPVTYLSATYAKRPDNMPIFYRTDLSEAVDDIDDIEAAFDEGGVPLQTAVSGMLARSLQLFRRERSFDGIEIRTEIDKANRKKHETLADELGKGLLAITRADRFFHTLQVEGMKEEAESAGGTLTGAGNKASKGLDHTNFTSVLHNYIAQILTAIKAERAVEDAIRLHKEGKKPVFALENTMGSFLENYVEQHGISEGEPVEANFRDVLQLALDRTRRVSVDDGTGERKSEEVAYDALVPNVKQAYDEAQAIIDSIDVEDIPLIPIDYIRNKLEKNGIRISELTGRDLRLDYSGPVPILAKRDPEEINDRRGVIDKFNKGELNALVINQSGATGLSIHASERFDDQKPRHMLVLQAPRDINIMMQMLGRINRTGQVVLPEYTLMGVDIPAEKRVLAVASKKMKSLNANTSANTESDTSLNAPDLLNKYGDEVVYEFLNENQNFAIKLDMMDDGKQGIAMKFTGRMPMLPVEEQRMIYSIIEANYSDYIDYLTKTGQNDLEPQTLDLDARIIESSTIYEGKNPDSIFGGNTFLHKVDAKLQGKPPTAEDAKTAINKFLSGRSPDEIVEEILAKKESDKAQMKALDKRIAEAEKTAKKADLFTEKKKSEAEAELKKAKDLKFSLEEHIKSYIYTVRTFKPGNRVRMDLNGDIVDGVVISIKDTHKKGKGNPYASSKTRITFMVNSGVRTVNLPISKLEPDGGIIKEHLGEYSESAVDQMFSEEFAGEPREIRYVATGNLIQGAAKLSGQVVSFTDNKGKTHQGILLPKSFKEEKFDALSRNVAIPLRDIDAVIRLLQRFPNEVSSAGGIKSPHAKGAEAEVRIQQERGEWKLITAKAKRYRIANKVRTHETIRRVVGDLFGRDKTLKGEIPDSALAKVVKAVAEVTPLTVHSSLREKWEAVGGPKLQEVEGFAQEAEAKPKKEPHYARRTLDQHRTVIEKDKDTFYGSDTKPGNRTVAAVQRDIQRVIHTWGGNAPTVKVVEKESHLPEHLQYQGEDIAGTVTQGVYDGNTGTVYLVAENLPNQKASLTILAHEAVSHYGLETMLGKEEFNKLIKRIQWLKRANSKRIRGAVQKVQQSYGQLDPETEAKEIIAVIGEERGFPSAFKDMKDRIYARVRAFLRKLGFRIMWSTPELNALLADAGRYLRRDTGGKETIGTVDFARRPAEAMKKIEGLLKDRPSATEFIKDKVKDYRQVWLGGFGLRHLIEVGQDVLPQLAEYWKVVRRLDFDRTELNNEAHELAERLSKHMRKNKKESEELAKLKQDATIAGVDPSVDYKPIYDVENLGEDIKKIQGQMRGRGGEAAKLQRRIDRLKMRAAQERNRKQAYPSLKRRYDLLTPTAKKLFTDEKEFHENRLDQMEKALEKRIERLKISKREKKAAYHKIKKQFETLRVQAPYFPLARFGEYWATGTNAEGERVFEMYPTIRKQREGAARLRSEGYNVRTGKKIETVKADFAANEGFMADIIAVLDKVGGPQIEVVKDSVYQLFLRTLPDLSMRKHSIHRKKTKGYSKDSIRAFSHSAFHGSYQLARLKYVDILESTMETMRTAIKGKRDPKSGKWIEEPMTGEKAVKASDVYSELDKRHQWLLNPTSATWSQVVTAVNFSWYLGLTPAAALVNMTQTPLVALPIIATRFGWKKASTEMGKLSKDMIGSIGTDWRKGFSLEKVLKGDELEVYKLLEREGVWDKTQGHDLAGMSETPSEIYSPVYSKVMGTISFMFHHAERFNREITGMLAYRLAYAKAKKGNTHDFARQVAMQYAIDVTEESHFNYSNYNKPRFMQGDVPRVIFIFKQFSVNMTYLLARNAYLFMKEAKDQGLGKAWKTEFRQKLTGILGMHALAAGTMGLPMFWLVEFILNALFDDEDEPFDAATEYRNFLTTHLGEFGGKAVAHGPIDALLGTGFAGRVSLNDLWFRDPGYELDKEATVEYWLSQVFGPTGPILTNAGRGLDLMNEGQIQRGIEYMVPKAIKDSLKSMRYAQEGVTNLRGDSLIGDTSAWQNFMQMMGMTPAEISERYERNRALKKYEGRILRRRRLLMNRYALAKRLGDKKGIFEAMQEIKKFNKSQPEIPITAATLSRSLKARARYSAEQEAGVHLAKSLRDLSDDVIWGAP